MLAEDINGYEKEEGWPRLLSGTVLERLSELKKAYLCEKQRLEE